MYCRAVRAGDQVAVAGTTAVDEQGNVVGEDLYGQAAYVFCKIEASLNELGLGLEDVIRTRSFVTDMDQFEGFAQAHREAFNGIDPPASCFGVSRLVDERLLIEVEVDAVRPSPVVAADEEE